MVIFDFQKENTKTILQPLITKLGLGVSFHPKYETVIVIDYLL